VVIEQIRRRNRLAEENHGKYPQLSDEGILAILMQKEDGLKSQQPQGEGKKRE
jgi:hypothetical protein